ncbi:MAG: multiprotein bridging factor aMBF1 [Candidatus Bathyarchaeia archaeon]
MGPLLICEICGKEIFERPKRIIVERAELTVCQNCSKLGEPAAEVRRNATREIRPRAAARNVAKIPKEFLESEVCEDFAERVRRGRIAAAMSQEDLAKRINEKVSVIQRVESGKMVPSVRLCRALEHALKIKLLVEARAEELIPRAQLGAAAYEPTLGDLAKIKRKGQ